MTHSIILMLLPLGIGLYLVQIFIMNAVILNGSAIKCQTTLKIYVFGYFLRIRSRIYMLICLKITLKTLVKISVHTLT